jgi:DNA-binding MarR family transcriptional regulator
MASLLKCIGVSQRCFNQYRDENMKPLGINGCHHMFIVNVCRTPGITQEKLSKLLYINKSNVTRTIDQLEADGFVLRQPSEEDKRSYLIYPTQKALDIYPKILDIIAVWRTHILSDFSEQEKELLINMMEKVMNKAINYVNQDYNESKVTK